MDGWRKSIYDLLEQAEGGYLKSCENCPRKPPRTIFGKNCKYHQYNGSQPKTIFEVALEPSRKSKTKLLCSVCNQDKTAANFRKFLMYIGIGKGDDYDDGTKWYATLSEEEIARLHSLYGTNAILHDYEDPTHIGDREKSMKTCEAILNEQLNILKPDIILVLGSEAARSIVSIFKENFKANENIKFGEMVQKVIKTKHYGHECSIIFLYHPSWQGFQNMKKYQTRKNMKDDALWEWTGNQIKNIMGWNESSSKMV